MRPDGRRHWQTIRDMHPPMNDACTNAGRQVRPRRTLAAAARMLATVPLALTVMPLSTTGRGWVRIWDFPRAHIAGLGLVAGVAMRRWGSRRPGDRLLTGALAASLLYQIAKIVPYTPL